MRGTTAAMSMLTGLTAAVTALLLLLPLPPSAAVDFAGMEDNCILSFVVPRDKVKSSCDMEERVTRRLNAMETKVTLYKQHVQELQEQLSKEREGHSRRLEELQQRLTLSEAGPADQGLQKRVQGLEEELRKIRALLASSARPTPSSPALGDRVQGRGISPGVVPVGRTREEEEKAVTVLVKAVVRSEVKKLFDNYTHYVGRYVRDQALAFNQIINMVPRHPPAGPHSNHLPPKWPHSNDIDRHSTPPPRDRNAVLLNELEGIRNRLNLTGKQPAEHVPRVPAHSVNLTTTLKPTPTPAASDGVPDSTAAGPLQNGQDPVRDSSLPDINDTASGDANETANDLNIAPLFTQLANDSDPSLHNLHVPASPDSQSSLSGGKDMASAKSRMSYNADLNKLPDPPAEGDSGGEKAEVEEVGNVSGGWQESMILDQNTERWIQAVLREEMQEVLDQQMDEVVSLVFKHTSMMDSRLHDQDVKLGQLEQRLAADIKHLSQVVSGLKLEMTSVSQGLQSLYSRMDQAEELEDTVMEMKRNMSQEGSYRLLATVLDEQGKKVRKVERLTGIYKQSLEHYRNDTKLELRALKELMGREVTVLRAQQTDLYLNLTDQTRHMAQQVNGSSHSHLEDIKQRVQVIEDNSLLQQIDLSSFERQLKSKSAKADRDLGRVSEDVSELKHKTRNLQKNLNSVMTGHSELVHNVNDTSTKMKLLQIEVQLNVLDDWVPYMFDYMKTRTDCFGEQFIRKSGFRVGRLVGVVLCNNTRYKIFLGQSLVDTFKNIGDDSGMGEDHCQFVNARNMAHVKVSPFRTSTETEPGYVRTHWGQEPRPELLNIIRPSPAWYECGVSIPR